MHDYVERMLFKKTLNRRIVFQIQFEKLKSRMPAQQSKPVPFQANVIIVVDVIQTRDIASGFKQLQGYVETDETGRTGYQNGFLRIH